MDPKQRVQVVHSSGSSIGSAAHDLSDARRWAVHHVAGEFQNEATGWTIHVSSKGIKEAIAHLNWSKDDTIQTLEAIPELVRVAVPIQSAPDTEERDEILEVHTLLAPFQIGSQVYRARMTIRETNMGHRYYGHRLEDLDIEVPEAFSRGLQGDTHPTIRRHSGTVSLGRLLDGFKPHTEKK